MKNESLDNLQALLQDVGYLVTRTDPTDANPFGSVAIALPTDDKGRVRSLVISVEEAPVMLPLDDAILRREVYVHMISALPFELGEGNLWEVLRTLNFFNRALPAPGFFLDEGSDQILFRYVFLQPHGAFEKELVLSLIGMILLWLDAASSSIEDTASGKPMFEVISERLANLS